MHVWARNRHTSAESFKDKLLHVISYGKLNLSSQQLQRETFYTWFLFSSKMYTSFQSICDHRSEHLTWLLYFEAYFTYTSNAFVTSALPQSVGMLRFHIPLAVNTSLRADNKN